MYKLAGSLIISLLLLLTLVGVPKPATAGEMMRAYVLVDACNIHRLCAT